MADCFSTGGAGLISTIRSFIDGHIVAGIFDTIACVGWGLETLGNLFFYRQVCLVCRWRSAALMLLVDLVSP